VLGVNCTAVQVPESNLQHLELLAGFVRAQAFSEHIFQGSLGMACKRA